MIRRFWQYVVSLFTRPTVTLTQENNPPMNTSTVVTKSVLIMRPRRASNTRRTTQVQIPLNLWRTFFSYACEINHLLGSRRLVVAHARGGRINTIKLELPEIKNMLEPVVRFTKTNGSISFEVFDGYSLQGVAIRSALNFGLGFETKQTKRNVNRATLYQQVA